MAHVEEMEIKDGKDGKLRRGRMSVKEGEDRE